VLVLNWRLCSLESGLRRKASGRAVSLDCGAAAAAPVAAAGLQRLSALVGHGLAGLERAQMVYPA